MRFVPFEKVAELISGKTVAVVGSGPSCTLNKPNFVDSHDLVVRVNNYKVGHGQGHRADIHYSFYGSSITKKPMHLKRDGVFLCMCKCPDGKPIESPWHEANGKVNGIDFSYIYRNRKDWWFCDTFIPDNIRFLASFKLLGGHIPTTGFAAIIDILACQPAHVFITGFDFFTSGMHNVDERWRAGKNTDDPIGHVPFVEAAWLKENEARYKMHFDYSLTALLARGVK